jgi:hypothetical protein
MMAQTISPRDGSLDDEPSALCGARTARKGAIISKTIAGRAAPSVRTCKTPRRRLDVSSSPAILGHMQSTAECANERPIGRSALRNALAEATQAALQNNGRWLVTGGTDLDAIPSRCSPGFAADSFKTRTHVDRRTLPDRRRL